MEMRVWGVANRDNLLAVRQNNLNSAAKVARLKQIIANRNKY